MCEVGVGHRDKYGAYVRSASLFISFILVVGCSQDSNLGRVHGRVRLEGKPLTSGTVRFVPAAGRASQGEIQSDGTYALGINGKSDGAVIGPSKVAIVAYDSDSFDRPAYENPNRKVKSLVPEKYVSPGTLGLTFEVKPGDNEANFDLSSK
jgi:hypothetical protein